MFYIGQETGVAAVSECDFTSAMETIVLLSYCVKVEECKANQMHNK